MPPYPVPPSCTPPVHVHGGGSPPPLGEGYAAFFLYFNASAAFPPITWPLIITNPLEHYPGAPGMIFKV